MKKSAGILVYRKKEKEIEVFLCHMGGPYWKNVERSWSLPKGEYSKETPKEAALREFQEETSFKINSPLIFLKSEKQPSGKLVTIFSTETDLDESKMKSNTFEMEWPKKSGKRQSFPNGSGCLVFFGRSREKNIKRTNFLFKKNKRKDRRVDFYHKKIAG